MFVHIPSYPFPATPYWTSRAQLLPRLHCCCPGLPRAIQKGLPCHTLVYFVTPWWTSPRTTTRGWIDLRHLTSKGEGRTNAALVYLIMPCWKSSNTDYLASRMLHTREVSRVNIEKQSNRQLSPHPEPAWPSEESKLVRQTPWLGKHFYCPKKSLPITGLPRQALPVLGQFHINSRRFWSRVTNLFFS